MATMLSRTLAEWAAGLNYSDLTPDAIDAAKRFLYDSLGCAFGGSRTHDCQIVERHDHRNAGEWRRYHDHHQ